jgi:hypothetical protein
LVHLAFFCAVLVCALLFALLEIQIEGGKGWAAALPTWRVENRWTRWIFSGRPLTGYHFYFHLFVFSILHTPYALALAEPSWAAEMRIIGFLTLFWIAEDFLWFVLNPSYGLSGFNPRDAWWHAESWWWFMPREYWIFTPVGILLYVLGAS